MPAETDSLLPPVSSFALFGSWDLGRGGRWPSTTHLLNLEAKGWDHGVHAFAKRANGSAERRDSIRDERRIVDRDDGCASGRELRHVPACSPRCEPIASGELVDASAA